MDDWASLFTTLSVGTSIALGLGIVAGPIGWAVIIGSGLWSWLCADDHKKEIAEAKQNLRLKMVQRIDKSKNNISSEIDEWVSSILNKLEKNHIGVMKKYVEASEKHIEECEDLSSDLRKMSKNSMKRKYREMLRCIQGDNQFKMSSVKENNGDIEIKIPSETISNREKAQQILSRVEEKPVIIRGGIG